MDAMKAIEKIEGKWLVAGLAVCVAALVALAGCSGGQGGAGSSESSESSSTASEESASAVDEAADYSVEVGSDSDGYLAVVVENDFGEDIADLAITAAGSADAADYLMTGEQGLANGERALVHFPEAEGATAYDVHVQTAGGDRVLHALDLASVDELALRLEGDVAYATFELGGSVVSTLQSEVELAEQAAAEAAAAEAAAVEEASSYSYDYGNSGGSAPSQGEQGCVDGGVQLR